MKNSNYTRDGINKETYRILFEEREEHKRECSNEIFTIEKSSLYNRKPQYLLSNFFNRIIDMYFLRINYFNLHKNVFSKGYTFKNKDIEFWFDYLEKYLKRILKNEDSYVRREMIFNLKHNLRYGSCFIDNMVISANIENSFYVTGLVEYDDGSTHLHSFVTYKDYVIDYTKNLIMLKEKYFGLLKIKELQSVESKRIASIYNTLLKNEILNSTRLIATFGNEIMSDLYRNPQLINESTDKPDFTLLF